MPLLNRLKRWIGSAALGLVLAASPIKAEEPAYAKPISIKLDMDLQLKLEKTTEIKKSPKELNLENAIAESMQKDSGSEAKLELAYGVALGMSVLELGLRFNEIKYLSALRWAGIRKRLEDSAYSRQASIPYTEDFSSALTGSGNDGRQ